MPRLSETGSDRCRGHRKAGEAMTRLSEIGSDRCRGHRKAGEVQSLHQLHRIFATQTRLIYSKAPKIMITRLIVSQKDSSLSRFLEELC